MDPIGGGFWADKIEVATGAATTGAVTTGAGAICVFTIAGAATTTGAATVGALYGATG